MSTAANGSLALWSDLRLEALPLRVSAFDDWAFTQGLDLHRTVVQRNRWLAHALDVWEVDDPTVSLAPLGKVLRVEASGVPEVVVADVKSAFVDASASLIADPKASMAPQLWRVLAHMAYWNNMDDMALLDDTIAHKQAFELMRCRTVYRDHPIDESTYKKLCDAFPQREPDYKTMSLDGFHAWWGESAQGLNATRNALTDERRASLHAQLANVESDPNHAVTVTIFRRDPSFVARLRNVHPLHHAVWSEAVERWYLERLAMPALNLTDIPRNRL